MANGFTKVEEIRSNYDRKHLPLFLSELDPPELTSSSYLEAAIYFPFL